MEFSEDTFKRRIAALLPAKAGSQGVNGDGQAAPSTARQDPVDLSGLWSIIDDEPFVQEAYRKILGRECDVSGFVNYLELLRRHIPRRVVVLQLVDSDEAKRRGIRFAGIPGSVSAAGRQAALTPLRRLTGRALSRVRELLRRPLYARFDSIDHKLNFILHDVTAKADNLSAKTDHALWTISKKLDTYVADLQEYQIQIRRVLSQESAASTAKAEAILARVAGVESRQAELRNLLEMELAKIRSRQLSPAITAGDNVVAAEVDGFIVGTPGEEWRMAAYHAFRGVLEPGLIARFRSLVKPGMVVVDVGANIGTFTLYAARQLAGRGKIYSFEPTPRTYRILEENVQVNGFRELGLIELHQSAVSDRAGKATLVVFKQDSGHNTLFDDGAALDGGGGAERVEVPTVPLDEILRNEPRVDVVKIDAEGAEPLILRGMREIVARSPGIRILMEFAPVHLRRAGVDPLAFLDEIASMKFEWRRIHDETGQPMDASREQVAAVFSANLELSRAGDSGGAI